MGIVWSTQNKIHLDPRWHLGVLVNSVWDTFCVHAVKGKVWSPQVEIYFVASHGRSLINTYWDEFPVPAGLGCVWAKQVEIHFMSPLPWDRFRQHELRNILYHISLVMGLVNSCCDVFSVLTGMCGRCEIYFVPSRGLSVLVNTCWNWFGVVARKIGNKCFDIHFVSEEFVRVLAAMGIV